jgi:large subunit ribosomal protein L25
MKIEVLKAQTRSTRGSSIARRLRGEGKVPGVLYGHGQEVVKLALGNEEMMQVLNSGHQLVAIEFDGKTERALVKAAQFDTWGKELLHVDFSRVALDELVRVTVEIVSHGTPKGTLAGAVLEQPLRRLEIACRADDIPENIRVEVAEMDVNDRIYVKDLPLPAGVKAMADADAIVFLVQETREEVIAPAAPTEAGAAEPEVIGKAEKEAAEAAEEGAEKGKDKAKA